MTLPATNQDIIAAALRKIGQGLLDLADAIPNAPGESAPKPRPAGRSSPQPSPSSAEEPTEEDDGEEEIKLADLQTMAKDLIKKGGRDKLRELLETHELETVSSAPEEKWPDLKNDLELALSEIQK